MSKRKFIKVIFLVIFTLIAVVLFPAVSCKSNQPKKIAYKFSNVNQQLKSWSEIFGLEAKIDSFKVLNTGKVLVPLKGVLNEKKLSKNHGFDKLIWVDVYAFLFHHKEKGWYLIDSGLDSTFQKKGNIKGPIAKRYIKKTIQKPEQNIAWHLKRENEKIEGIFLTHLHGDHTAGLPEIDTSIPKYVGLDDKYINIPFLYYSNHLSNNDILYTLDYRKGIRIKPFNSVLDVFGDSSFFAIHTPGHSNGHMSYLLITNDRPILLTGDASHTRYGFENGIEPGWVSDGEKAQESLSKLIEFNKKHPQVKIIYGHQQ